jgi:hypothetical protein
MFKHGIPSPDKMISPGRFTRRTWLRDVLGAASLAVWAAGCVRPTAPGGGERASGFHRFSPEETGLLDDIERTACRFFWEASHPKTGLTRDRVAVVGTESRTVASIAATGFGLAALCVAAERGYLPVADVRERVRVTLRFLSRDLPHEHGFFFHFVHWETGERVWKCELSSIDTGLLLCGVLLCGEYFDDDEIRSLARSLYERVDWPWMLNGGDAFALGWTPEGGFFKNRWDHYCELMLLYLLALGSETHPVPSGIWHAWRRPVYQYFGQTYIGSPAPLFVHQFSHAFFDFRGRSDAGVDWFENSRRATEAHRRFCLKLADRFPQFGGDLWGITSSDSARGYVGWGGPPLMGALDGTLVPCAAAGSLPFLPSETMRVLRTMRGRFGGRVWTRYGFIDAFNPHTNWFNPDVIGIDVGISVLMAENARTGFVWRTFMRNEPARRGMARAGFGH